MNFIHKIIDIFKGIDKKDLKIMRNGLKFCFLILLVSIAILVTYLFFVNTIFVYEIGILIFQLSLYLAIDFVVAGIVVDTIQKQIF